MADEQQQPAEVTPEEARAIVLAKINEVLRYCLVEGEDGPALDLDQLTRLLIQRAVPYTVLNRELTWTELQIVRDELHVQRTRAEQEGDEGVVAGRRYRALLAREEQILDQLWPS